MQVLAADFAAFEFVSVGAGPVGFEMQVASVAVGGEGFDLAFPVDVAGAYGAPDGLVGSVGVQRQTAVLDVDVADASGVEEAVAVREGLFAREVGVGRVPDNLEVFMVNCSEDFGGFLGGRNVAGVLVFDADDEAVFLRLIGEVLEGVHHTFEDDFGGDYAPVGEDADDFGAG